MKVQEQVKAAAKDDGFDVIQDLPQDPGQAGKAQVTAMAKLLHGFNFRSSPESGDKETRAVPFAAQVEAHNVFLVKATWNYDFVEEAATFPTGTFKDQIDAASRAYAAVLVQEPTLIGAGPVVMQPDRNDYAAHRTGEGYVIEDAVLEKPEQDYSGFFINIQS